MTYLITTFFIFIFQDTEHLLHEIEEDRIKVNKVRAVVKEEEEVTDMETKKGESIALDAQRDLDSALPQLEQATAALDSLSKSLLNIV